MRNSPYWCQLTGERADSQCRCSCPSSVSGKARGTASYPGCPLLLPGSLLSGDRRSVGTPDWNGHVQTRPRKTTTARVDEGTHEISSDEEGGIPMSCELYKSEMYASHPGDSLPDSKPLLDHIPTCPEYAHS